MKLDGAKQCFQYLADKDVKVSSFISDRHKGIAKWIRETQPNVQHYNDIWHVSKSLTKKLLKASKEKDNESILLWMKAIRKHLYWVCPINKAGIWRVNCCKVEIIDPSHFRQVRGSPR